MKKLLARLKKLFEKKSLVASEVACNNPGNLEAIIEAAVRAGHGRIARKAWANSAFAKYNEPQVTEGIDGERTYILQSFFLVIDVEHPEIDTVSVLGWQPERDDLEATDWFVVDFD